MNVSLVSCDDLPGWEVDDNPLIFALQEKGVTVHRPSWSDDIDWGQFDISVIRTTWDYHKRKDEFVDWCKQVPRLFNNAEIVEWNIHKSYLRELQEQGVAIATTLWISKNQECDIADGMEVLHSNKGFIKPQVGACASDTLRFDVNSLDSAQEFLNANLHQDMMVQPYISSVESEGELTAIFFEDTFTHGVQKIPVPGDYRVQDDFGASDIPFEFTQDEIDAMREVLQLVPHHEDLLYARFDYLRADDGILLLSELELIEPSLFFRHCAESAEIFADAIINRAMIQQR